MSKLNLSTDPTLDSVNSVIEATQDRDPRNYLGMSSIGKSCERELWYQFRFALFPFFDAKSLKRFEDGHHGEDLQAKRLRMVPGITLMTVDENTGNQYGFEFIGGHLKGHMDGAILGLLQAPKTWHVWEHKQVDQKKFDKLNKLKAEHGEKNALEKWDEIYWAQAIMYMGATGMTRHYLTCSTPGGRETTSVRTNVNPAAFERLMAKAQRIVTAQEPPPRISDDPDWFQCKFCDFREICHGTAAPLPTCRSCCHATPELDGNARWSCARHQADLSVEEQREGCQAHLFIPALLANWAEVVDASLPGNWVMYQHKETGKSFKNGLRMECFQSAEIHAVEDKRALTDETVQEIRQGFDGRLVA